MTATDTEAPLPKSTQRVTGHLCTLGYEKNIVTLSATGKTSAEAAAGLGYSVAEIAKSIILRRAEDDVPVLVITSGTNRVDEIRVSVYVGAPAKADAKFAREKTGYAIGGVYPVGHAIKSVMLLSQDLLRHDSLWTVADHPHAVFNLMPAELEIMTSTPVADIIQRD